MTGGKIVKKQINLTSAILLFLVLLIFSLFYENGKVDTPKYNSNKKDKPRTAILENKAIDSKIHKSNTASRKKGYRTKVLFKGIEDMEFVPTPKIISMERQLIKLGIEHFSSHIYTYYSNKHNEPITIKEIFKLTGLSIDDFIRIEMPSHLQLALESRWLAEKGNIECVIGLNEVDIDRGDRTTLRDYKIIPKGKESIKINYISITARRHPDAVSSLRKYKADYKTMKEEGGVITFGE